MISVNDERVEHQPGLTVRRLLDDRGFGAAMVAVWIGDEMVARDRYDTTEVPDGSDVKIVLMIAGG